MLLTSTMKPFDVGDIFLGCTYLNNPNDDHMGDGRILQFDKYWRPKGTLYTEDTRYFIVGCKMGPDGTLWAFDCHDHITLQISPEGKQINAWDSGRSFGSGQVARGIGAPLRAGGGRLFPDMAHLRHPYRDLLRHRARSALRESLRSYVSAQREGASS